MNIFRGTREYAFEMSHALFMELCDSELNQKIYGREVQPHGHNWKVRLEIQGAKDYNSQMILDLSDLDKIGRQEIEERYDHREFTFHNFDKVPTLEILTEVIYNSVKQKCIFLSSVEVQEIPTLSAIYFGGPEVYISTSIQFSGRHRTHNPELRQAVNEQLYGKCNRYHGHNYTLVVTLKGLTDPDSGLVVNRVALDKALDEFVETHLAYKTLNEIPDLPNENATTENLIEVIWSMLNTHLIRENITVVRDKYSPKLYRIRIHETDRNHFDYFGPDNKGMLQ